jgi:hypothetical protein
MVGGTSRVGACYLGAPGLQVGNAMPGTNAGVARQQAPIQGMFFDASAEKSLSLPDAS